MCVASRSHAFATVTFTPQAMQTYQCIFEATLDGLPRYQLPRLSLQDEEGMPCPAQPALLTGLPPPVPCSNLTRNRSLGFDIVGEGTLPRVIVVRPVLCNQHGNPLLLFKRLLLGQSEKLPLVLKNNGTIPAQVLRGVKCGTEREKNDSEVGLSALRSRPSLTCEDFDVPHTLTCVRRGTRRAKSARVSALKECKKAEHTARREFLREACAGVYPEPSGEDYGYSWCLLYPSIFSVMNIAFLIRKKQKKPQ